MKFTVILASVCFCFSSCLYASCPSRTCPGDMDTPVVAYDFEGNLNDSSGHSLHAGETSPAGCPVTYHTGIGGRPGASIDSFRAGAGCGVTLPACSFWNSEGEIEWYQYLTMTPATKSNGLFFWCNLGCSNGGIQIYTGDNYINAPDAVRVQYSTWTGSAMTLVQYGCDCVLYNTWQHYSFQWGSFGTRLVVDGIVRSGSFETWWQGPMDYDTAFLGTGIDENSDMFMGYIDDLKIWPCSGHGTPTATPTLTWTGTNTVTLTPTITPTGTITETHTITGTETPYMTGTAAGTYTITPVSTFTYTRTLTPTVTPPPTASPTPPDTKFFGAFPNPAVKTVRLVFSSSGPCRADLSVYTVSGEKTGSASINAVTGMNALQFTLRNRSGVLLSSGVYLYRLGLEQPGGSKRVFTGKFSVLQ